MKKKALPSKFLLYERSVQSPQWQVDYLPQFHTWLTGKPPISLREDFCGSGKISCEWVKRSKKNRALGLDIDPETLHYAETVNKAELTSEQRKRVQFLNHDVLKPTQEKFDWIGAYNFSIFTFHQRKEMLRYLKAAYASLKSKGTIFLEVAGGDGFIEELLEPKEFSLPGQGTFEQTWEQHQYDPITAVNDYSIHFKNPKGECLNDAFTYHWRIWGIRELREVLEEAGFKKTTVLWEHDEGKDEYLPSENADYSRSWIAYVVGVKGHE